MFEFFKNKKAGKAIKNILSGCFVFVFIAIAAYGLLTPQTTSAQTNTAASAASTGATLVGNLFNNPFSTLGGALTSGLVSIYVGFSIPIAAFLLWGSAELLEMTIKYSVLQLGQYIGPGSAVAETWKVLRDFGNMFFIFILLYTAIMTILGMGSGDVKKIVVKVIIMAVLINFSFFFTKVAIDASNIVSIAFYKQIVSSTCNGDPSANQPEFVNIGGAFMCHLGLTKMFSSEIVANMGQYFVNGFAGSAALLRFATLGSALMVMLAIILFAGCILFLYRFVSILLLLAFSPLAFAALAFPSDKYSGRWTKPLIEVCISAPVFMLFTWVTLRLAGSLTNGQSGSIVDVIASQGLFDAGTNPGLITQNIQASLNFFVIAAMMVATLIISKEVGAAGAGWGLKAMKTFQGRATGYFKNTAGTVSGMAGRMVVRNTVKKFDENLGKTAFGQSFYGQQLRKAVTKPALEAKFGSQYSVKSLEEAQKKSKEEYAKKVGEGIQKDIGKNIMNLRNDYITENQEKIDSIKELNRLQNLEQERATLERDIERLAGGPESAELTEKERRLKEITETEPAEALTQKINTLRTKTQSYGNASVEKIQNEIEVTKKNIEEDVKLTGDEKKGIATGAEIARWTPGKQREKLESLKTGDSGWKFALLNFMSAKEREHAREELAKKIRNPGKDVKKMLKDLQKEVLGDEAEEDDKKEGDKAKKEEGGSKDESKKG